MRKEEKMHQAVCHYLGYQYPGTVFISEASGIRVSAGMAAKLKKIRSNDTLPDLYILEPRGAYHGLILELKTEEAQIYKKDGTLRANEHVEAQAKTLDKLKKKGYYAAFVQGFDEAKEVIDNYMNNGEDN